MPKSNFKKFDHIAIGLIIGLLLPVISMHFILKYYSNLDLLYLIENPMFSGILNDLKGCLFINLGVFFLFYWLKKDKSAKGVVFATLLYGIVYLYYMFAL